MDGFLLAWCELNVGDRTKRLTYVRIADLQAKHGVFSLEACGDPVFRAREGFGRPGAKESLHTG